MFSFLFKKKQKSILCQSVRLKMASKQRQKKTTKTTHEIHLFALIFSFGENKMTIITDGNTEIFFFLHRRSHQITTHPLKRAQREKEREKVFLNNNLVMMFTTIINVNDDDIYLSLSLSLFIIAQVIIIIIISNFQFYILLCFCLILMIIIAIEGFFVDCCCCCCRCRRIFHYMIRV